MARQINRLTARRVETVKETGLFSDGGGLYLAVSDSGAKNWRLILSVNGKRREKSLGSARIVSLADARRKRDEALKLRHEGHDPFALWAEPDRDDVPTFGSVALDFIASKEAGWRNAKHRQQWRSTLTTYAARIWEKPVEDVVFGDVLAILKPIWSTKAETAKRVRGRIERVLDYAKFMNLRRGENPAAWKGNLEHPLPAQQKGPKRHHSAMPYEEAPAFFERLRERNSVSAKALQFTMLTAARTGEALGATWQEIDLNKALWTIPASRMKASKEHQVPLSAAAVNLLKTLKLGRAGEEFVFPGQAGKKPLSNMAMLMLLRRMKVEEFTVHGFRSTFRDWAGDKTDVAREVVEQALAHTFGKVERAYRRGHALEKRRALMEAWAAFLAENDSSATRW
jgi:integrase